MTPLGVTHVLRVPTNVPMPNTGISTPLLSLNVGAHGLPPRPPSRAAHGCGRFARAAMLAMAAMVAVVLLSQSVRVDAAIAFCGLSTWLDDVTWRHPVARCAPFSNTTRAIGPMDGEQRDASPAGGERGLDRGGAERGGMRAASTRFNVADIESLHESRAAPTRPDGRTVERGTTWPAPWSKGTRNGGSCR